MVKKSNIEIHFSTQNAHVFEPVCSQESNGVISFLVDGPELARNSIEKVTSSSYTLLGRGGGVIYE